MDWFCELLRLHAPNQPIVTTGWHHHQIPAIIKSSLKTYIMLPWIYIQKLSCPSSSHFFHSALKHAKNTHTHTQQHHRGRGHPSPPNHLWIELRLGLQSHRKRLTPKAEGFFPPKPVEALGVPGSLKCFKKSSQKTSGNHANTTKK